MAKRPKVKFKPMLVLWLRGGGRNLLELPLDEPIYKRSVVETQWLQRLFEGGRTSTI